MNQAASHPASRGELPGATQNGKLLQAEGGRDKERVDYIIFLWGKKRGYVADYLIGTEQKIPD